MIEFMPWSKVARLNRDITITEKIDGTNAAVGIFDPGEYDHDFPKANFTHTATGSYWVYAQSRSRIITPDKDNFGFARWVWDNAGALASTLGPGLHFGEWWGSGIQRNYGLSERRFSLFNTKRWHNEWSNWENWPEGLYVVPVLYEGPFDTNFSFEYYKNHYPEELAWPAWIQALSELEIKGSKAAPGFMNPEGIVIYHHAANEMFKVTLEGDEVPKSLAAA